MHIFSIYLNNRLQVTRLAAFGGNFKGTLSTVLVLNNDDSGSKKLLHGPLCGATHMSWYQNSQKH